MLVKHRSQRQVCATPTDDLADVI